MDTVAARVGVPQQLFERGYLTQLNVRLGILILELSEHGKIKKYSSSIEKMLGYSRAQMRHLAGSDLFTRDTWNDLFKPNRREIWEGGVSNYRGFLKDAHSTPLLVQLSGYYEKTERGGVYRMVLQKLSNLNGFRQIDPGYFHENIKAHEIIRRYIPPSLYNTAQIVAKTGANMIPNESKFLTFFFADLVSFTTFAENKSPNEVIETLNLSLGAATSTIAHWSGHIDKIMGDSIMAVFADPLDAIIAGIEIQKAFRIFNIGREEGDLDKLEMRIGINSGSCIHGSIGTEKFMEWTVIGDAVNTASRLEKACRVGGVLVSKKTVDLVREHVQIAETVELAVKGKRNQLTAHYLDQVSFHSSDGELIELRMDDLIDLF